MLLKSGSHLWFEQGRVVAGRWKRSNDPDLLALATADAQLGCLCPHDACPSKRPVNRHRLRLTSSVTPCKEIAAKGIPMAEARRQLRQDVQELFALRQGCHPRHQLRWQHMLHKRVLTPGGQITQGRVEQGQPVRPLGRVSKRSDENLYRVQGQAGRCTGPNRRPGLHQPTLLCLRPRRSGQSKVSRRVPLLGLRTHGARRCQRCAKYRWAGVSQPNVSDAILRGGSARDKPNAFRLR
jgi:hypothetical protein